jgi:uncharacterized membrane protein YeaQ/YmgE (transglycosylase-associated protein family)
MNIIMWVLAGAAIGWAGFAVLGFNEARGMYVSIVIGAVGGFLGGNVLAPMLSSAAVAPEAFNFLALFVAAISAAACLTIGNMVHKRFGV